MAMRILLLCENEKSAVLDKRALRDFGYGQPLVMTSGIAAARLLAGLEKGEDPPEIVVCSHKLADMDGEQFCAIIREHPRLDTLPILLLMPNEEEAHRLDTMGCGASAILGRPYSMEALTKILTSLRGVAHIRRQTEYEEDDNDTRAFDTALATYGILLRQERLPEDFFRAGMTYLKEKRWNFSISAFEMAMRDEHFKAEAELGLAAACKGKGDMLRFRAWLGKASETLVRDKRWQRARNTFARLLQQDPAAKNPFFTEAHRLIRLNDYAAAADALAHGIELIPKKQTGDRFARLCFAAGNPEAMRQELEKKLTQKEGAHADSIIEEIRARMESLSREREEREKLQIAERKWQLARKINAQKMAAHNPTVEEAAIAYGLPDKGVPEFAENLESHIAESDDLELDESVNIEDTPGLMPLTEDDAANGMFSGKTRLNDFLSVMKLTWNLARRTKDK